MGSIRVGALQDYVRHSQGGSCRRPQRTPACVLGGPLARRRRLQQRCTQPACDSPCDRGRRPHGIRGRQLVQRRLPGRNH